VDVKRPRHLEQENAKKRSGIEIEVMKEVAAYKGGRARAGRQVAYVHERRMSLRRACALLSVARSTFRYESRLQERDAPVVAVMRELAAQYPRYGYRRIQVFLALRGHVMSADRDHRKMRLAVVRRSPRSPRHIRADSRASGPTLPRSTTQRGGCQLTELPTIWDAGWKD